MRAPVQVTSGVFDYVLEIGAVLPMSADGGATPHACMHVFMHVFMQLIMHSFMYVRMMCVHAVVTVY